MVEKTDAEKPTFRVRTRKELLAGKEKRVQANEKRVRASVQAIPGFGLNPLVPGNPFRDEKLRTVEDMGFDPELLKQVPESVRQLTVNDLDDFARRMSGLDVRNKRVEALTIEDIQGIEALFADTKEMALVAIAGRLGEGVGLDGLGLAEVDVSCCCCTPCCCCAATESNPFAVD